MKRNETPQPYGWGVHNVGVIYFTCRHTIVFAVQKRPGGAFQAKGDRKTPRPFGRGVLVLALSIFTCSHPHTIVDEPELNFCVRDGNRWTLRTINTNFVEASFISLAPADPLSRPVESSLIPLPLLSRSNPLALGFERGPCFFRFMGPSQDCILKTEHSDESKEWFESI